MSLDLFVDSHNRKVRNYWNERKQSISCRVRSTKKGNASNFRKNIVQWIYKKNKEEYNSEASRLYLEDYGIIQTEFGFDKKDLTNKESFALAMEVRDLSFSQVILALRLNNVVSTKLLGFQKEVFFLKCYLIGETPQFALRVLYHLETDIDFKPRPHNYETYRDEIRDLLAII